MNLLLLLSALLSALTGVGASARQPQVAQAVAQQARVVVAAARVAPSHRPVATPAALAALAAAPVATAWRLTAAVPAFASRRRE